MVRLVITANTGEVMAIDLNAHRKIMASVARTGHKKVGPTIVGPVYVGGVGQPCPLTAVPCRRQ